MTRQLQHGAARLIELMSADITDTEAYLAEARVNIRRNPGLCEDAIGDAMRELARLRRRIETDLAPLLERRAPRDELVAATEAMRAALERLERDNVTEFRKAQ